MRDFFDQFKQGINNNIPKNINPKAGMIGAAGVGGLLGALFGGSKGVQRTAKNVAVIGGSAALAALAYKMYQNWSSGGSQNQNAPQGQIPQQGGYGYGAQAPQPYQQQPYGQPQNGYGQPQNAYGAGSGAASSNDPFAAYNAKQQNEPMLLGNDMGKLIIQAMVFAARADGHIDANEQEMILGTARNVSNDPNFNQLITEYLNQPLNPASIAAKVSSPSQAMDIYRLSAAAIVADNIAEQNYLNDLAKALQLSPATTSQLNQEAARLRSQMSGQ